MKSTAPLAKQTILSINQQRVQGPKDFQSIKTINAGRTNTISTDPIAVKPGSVVDKPCPPLLKPVRKGQKVPLESSVPLTKISARLGWNIVNSNCDVDVSAFLLNSDGKVLGDTWFVFYGQEISPDGSTKFFANDKADRETISINLSKLNPNVSKIVLVLTINEALAKNLNFSMIKDAYVRILDDTSNTEVVSFKMDQYYSNVTSMMIGEVYRYNGSWKFHAIGNGVARDLAGLCELYGVQVI